MRYAVAIEKADANCSACVPEPGTLIEYAEP